jgi:hypothetical protein
MYTDKVRIALSSATGQAPFRDRRPHFALGDIRPCIHGEAEVFQLAYDFAGGGLYGVDKVIRTNQSLEGSRLERSRWRGGRFACYAPRVMPRRNASNCGSRTCSFSKYRKTNSLQVSEKIEFP